MKTGSLTQEEVCKWGAPGSVNQILRDVVSDRRVSVSAELCSACGPEPLAGFPSGGDGCPSSEEVPHPYFLFFSF